MRCDRFFMALMLLMATTSAWAVTNAWSTAAPLATARYNHTATLLPSGKVLVAGGVNNAGGAITSAELYDPATNTWSPAGSLAYPHAEHTATLLPSGKVLVAAGGNNVAELYDPATNSWSGLSVLATARQRQTATLLPSGKVLVAGGNNGGALASAELYDPTTNTWSAAGTLTTGRYFHTATLLPSGKVLVAAGIGVSGATNTPVSSAELYDPTTNGWSSAGSLATARYHHTATLLPSGKVLVAAGYNGLILSSAELYDPASNTWSGAASLAATRMNQSATLLPSGKLLVAAGQGGVPGNSTALTTAEIFDPAANTWSATGALAVGRYQPTATLLPSGRVLLVGGRATNGSALASTELYDPAANAWSSAGTLATARSSHTATLLPSGKTLVAGGIGGGSLLNSPELHDPATNSWSAAGALATARARYTATLLPSGKVLAVAGNGPGNSFLSSAELYDPASNTWSAAGSLATGRDYHTATLLPSGKVLVVGGTGTGNTVLNSAELYDPATNSWSSAGTLSAARYYHTATLLPSGKVLVAGGRSGAALNSAELYDPASNSWSAAGSLATARYWHTATLLPSGKVIVAGGYSTSSTELYDPATNTWSAAGSLATTRYWHTATLLPSGKVIVAGGYNGFTLGSTELYDPITNAWSAAPSLATARLLPTATLLPSGRVLLVGGADTDDNTFNSAEQFEPGLASAAALQPSLSAVNAFLLQASPLVGTSSGSTYTGGVVTATGLRPKASASGGGYADSATNNPVFQIERLDNQQQRFIANDTTVSFTDTTFTGSTTALAGFPAGPVLVRVWVNGVPSVARYSTLATTPGRPAAPIATGGTQQAAVTFTPVGETGGAPVTSYTATASPGGATASCTAPCTSITFNPMAVGTYTFTVHATTAAGNGPESPASNSVQVTSTMYTVGGTVSGLAGSGLVLSLNSGAQDLPISTNGTFTFPTAIAGGSTYAVTVGTQPSSPTQTCTVTSGSGTVGSANVTNVAVACTTSTYTIGGSASGIDVSGLVLQLNGGSNLAVNANGAFTFTTPIASGSTYTVTILSQPAGRSCTLTNASGTVAAANIANVSVACIALPQLVLSATDDRLFARYGHIVDYAVILANNGDGDASSISVTFALSAGFDGAAAQLICSGAGSGATCTQDSTNPLLYHVALPAHRSLNWLISLPVRSDASGPTIDFGVGATGATPVTDTDTLVIFRDGFDVPNGDGTQTLPVVEGAQAQAILGGDALHEVMVPITPSATTQPLLLVRDDARELRVDWRSFSGLDLVRLLERDLDGRERATPWSLTQAGATLELGSEAMHDGAGVDNQEAVSREIVLVGAAPPPSLRH